MYVQKLTVGRRIAPLEKQIIDLTSETERLSRTLENQRNASKETEMELQKSLDERNRQLSQRVSVVSFF